MFFAYLIVNKKSWKPVYVGQGTLRRVYDYNKPSAGSVFGQSIIIGLTISCDTREQALNEEKKLIAQYNPPFNKARWSSYGGLTLSERHRAAISKARTGKSLSIEHRQKLREANLGKSLTIEARAKISLAGRGRPKSKQHRENIRNALCKPEIRAKLSEANRLSWLNPETRRKRLEARQRSTKK